MMDRTVLNDSFILDGLKYHMRELGMSRGIILKVIDINESMIMIKWYWFIGIENLLRTLKVFLLEENGPKF